MRATIPQPSGSEPDALPIELTRSRAVPQALADAEAYLGLYLVAGGGIAPPTSGYEPDVLLLDSPAVSTTGGGRYHLTQAALFRNANGALPSPTKIESLCQPLCCQ